MRYLLWGAGLVVTIVLVAVVVGWRLPVRHTVSRSTTVVAPPDTVFALITGFEQYPAWRSGVKQVEVLPGAPFRFREHGPDGAILFEVRERTAERLVTRIADPGLPFGGQWTFEVRPAGAGTDLRITEDGEVYNPLFRFVSRYIMGHSHTIDRYLNDVAARFANPGTQD